MNFWSVRCNVPKWYGTGEAKYHMSPESFGVVAETIDDVLAKVRAEIPGVVVLAVNHSGKVRFDARDRPTNTEEMTS